jgi:hypothetical protein
LFAAAAKQQTTTSNPEQIGAKGSTNRDRPDGLPIAG